MGKSYVIMRDYFVLEKVFDESEEEKAKNYLKHLKSNYDHVFTMKLVDDSVLDSIIKTVTNPEYQVAIAQSRR